MNTHFSRPLALTTLVGALFLATPAVAQDALTLTIDDAIRRAIEHNPELAIVQLGTDVQRARVDESKGAWVPMFSADLGRSSAATPPTNAFLGEAGVDVDDWFSSTGVRQRVPAGGGTWSVSWEAARTSTTSPISRFDPSLQSGLLLAYSQPLLRNRAVDEARYQYAVAKRNESSAGLRVREAVVQTIAAVKQAYWTLKAARANVDVQQRSLELASELARENKVKVDAGQIPPLDLVQAEAEIATRRDNLIRARAVADDAEDVLRRLIIDPADASFWRVRLETVEEPTPIDALPDIDSAVTRALDERYDLARADQELENARTTVEYLKNQRLPDVRLEASYLSSGLGGSQFLRTDGFPGSVIGRRDFGFNDTLGQVFTNDYPTWSLGVTVSYPIGRSFEEASHARAEVERKQVAQKIASLRVQAAEMVRRTGRQVHSTAERVQAARAGAELARERLNSEQRRLEVGLSTTFLVTQAQRDLLEAEVNLLRTTLEFESAQVAFQAVQQAPAPGEGDAIGVRGSNVVPVPPPSPRGIFRPSSAGF